MQTTINYVLLNSDDKISNNKHWNLCSGAFGNLKISENLRKCTVMEIEPILPGLNHHILFILKTN